MQMEFDSKKLNCIEVKGMNNLSVPYVRRFFGHAGQVEEIKKANDKVIVRFRYPSSVTKAHRFNGRVVDKEPIKVRNLSITTPVEEIPGRKLHKTSHLRQLNEKISDRMKYGPLDVSYHWERLQKILGNFQDDQLCWLIYELFVTKLNQIYALHFYGNNDRSKYSEYVLKEMILTHNKQETPISSNIENSSTRKLQYSAYLPDDLQYEATYEAWNNRMENRIRHRFLSLRGQGQGLKLFHLYLLFYRNSLKLDEEAVLVSDSEKILSSQKLKRITIDKIYSNRYKICIEDYLPKCAERSQYRSIDCQHPSKDIQIFSDSVFHEGPSSAVVFQLLQDQFDGCISNSFATNIFHELKVFFAPNCLLIKHTDSRKNTYHRLFFQLRILDCGSQVFEEKEYFMLWTPQSMTNLQVIQNRQPQRNNIVPESISKLNQKLRRTSATKMQKHNLIFGNYANEQMIFYTVEQYLDYYCGFSEEETDSQYSRSLSVFLICSNIQPQEISRINDFVDQWKSREKIMKSKAVLYIITIIDSIAFQKQKIRNYLETHIDSIIKIPINNDIARMRAKQFLLQTPDKFHSIQEPQKFITNTILELYEQRGKRSARNQILKCVKKVRK